MNILSEIDKEQHGWMDGINYIHETRKKMDKKAGDLGRFARGLSGKN